jgi:hypothetical protein
MILFVSDEVLMVPLVSDDIDVSTDVLTSEEGNVVGSVVCIIVVSFVSETSDMEVSGLFEHAIHIPASAIIPRQAPSLHKFFIAIMSPFSLMLYFFCSLTYT